MNESQCITPRQGDWFHIYVVKCDGYTEGVFTNKVQAEAYIRECRTSNQWQWTLISYDTQPHNNNC